MNDNSTPFVIPHVEINPEGRCEPNLGPGGYGVVLVRPKKRAEPSGENRLTTNNRTKDFGAIKWTCWDLATGVDAYRLRP